MADHEIHELQVRYQTDIAEEQPLRKMQQLPPADEREARPVTRHQITRRDRDEPVHQIGEDQNPIAVHEHSEQHDDDERLRLPPQHVQRQHLEPHVALVVDQPHVLQRIEESGHRDHPHQRLDLRLVHELGLPAGGRDQTDGDERPAQHAQGPGSVVVLGFRILHPDYSEVETGRGQQVEHRIDRLRQRDDAEIGGRQDPHQHQHADQADEPHTETRADHVDRRDDRAPA